MGHEYDECKQHASNGQPPFYTSLQNLISSESKLHCPSNQWWGELNQSNSEIIRSSLKSKKQKYLNFHLNSMGKYFMDKNFKREKIPQNKHDFVQRKQLGLSDN